MMLHKLCITVLNKRVKLYGLRNLYYIGALKQKPKLRK